MDRGELVPDTLMIDIIRTRLQEPDARSGFILDGFPRTVAQAEALDAMLDQLGRRVDAVIYLRVSRQVLIDRLSHRSAAAPAERCIPLRRSRPATSLGARPTAVSSIRGPT